MAFDLNKEVQDFGPYQLVIRHPKDARAFAVLWRGGEKLAFAEGDTREKAYDEMLGPPELRSAGDAARPAQGARAPAVCHRSSGSCEVRLLRASQPLVGPGRRPLQPGVPAPGHAPG